jgi:hypothetical protein
MNYKILATISIVALTISSCKKDSAGDLPLQSKLQSEIQKQDSLIKNHRKPDKVIDMSGKLISAIPDAESIVGEYKSGKISIHYSDVHCGDRGFKGTDEYFSGYSSIRLVENLSKDTLCYVRCFAGDSCRYIYLNDGHSDCYFDKVFSEDLIASPFMHYNSLDNDVEIAEAAPGLSNLSFT